VERRKKGRKKKGEGRKEGKMNNVHIHEQTSLYLYLLL
jgi:hypothetical protein